MGSDHDVVCQLPGWAVMSIHIMISFCSMENLSCGIG